MRFDCEAAAFGRVLPLRSPLSTITSTPLCWRRCSGPTTLRRLAQMLSSSYPLLRLVDQEHLFHKAFGYANILAVGVQKGTNGHYLLVIPKSRRTRALTKTNVRSTTSSSSS